jgi:outer membrane lipoprotein SlyB
MTRRAAVALLTVLALAGCATGQAPVSPAYTQDELRAQCERHRGWWRPGGVRDGFCEFDSQM